MPGGATAGGPDDEPAVVGSRLGHDFKEIFAKAFWYAIVLSQPGAFVGGRRVARLFHKVAFKEVQGRFIQTARRLIPAVAGQVGERGLGAEGRRRKPRCQARERPAAASSAHGGPVVHSSGENGGRARQGCRDQRAAVDARYCFAKGAREEDAARIKGGAEVRLKQDVRVQSGGQDGPGSPGRNGGPQRDIRCPPGSSPVEELPPRFLSRRSV